MASPGYRRCPQDTAYPQDTDSVLRIPRYPQDTVSPGCPPCPRTPNRVYRRTMLPCYETTNVRCIRDRLPRSKGASASYLLDPPLLKAGGGGKERSYEVRDTVRSSRPFTLRDEICIHTHQESKMLQPFFFYVVGRRRRLLGRLLQLLSLPAHP